MKLSDEAEKIRQNGWHQGSLLKIDSKVEVSGQRGVINPGLYIIISQDCDIQTPAIDVEPYVEIILCDPISKPDGNYTRGKNARRLHIPFNQGAEEVYFECFAKNKFVIARRELIKQKPCKEFSVGPEQTNDLIGWCIKRYDRDAFPDHFNERLDRKKLRNIMRGALPSLQNVFIKLRTEKELSLNEIYRIELYFIVDKCISSDDIEQTEILLNAFSECLKHEQKIEIAVGAVLTTEEIYLAEFLELKQLDFDDLSSM